MSLQRFVSQVGWRIVGILYGLRPAMIYVQVMPLWVEVKNGIEVNGDDDPKFPSSYRSRGVADFAAGGAVACINSIECINFSTSDGWHITCLVS